MTAASSMAGCEIRRASSSAGGTWKEPDIEITKTEELLLMQKAISPSVIQSGGQSFYVSIPDILCILLTP